MKPLTNRNTPLKMLDEKVLVGMFFIIRVRIDTHRSALTKIELTAVGEAHSKRRIVLGFDAIALEQAGTYGQIARSPRRGHCARGTADSGHLGGVFPGLGLSECHAASEKTGNERPTDSLVSAQHLALPISLPPATSELGPYGPILTAVNSTSGQDREPFRRTAHLLRQA
jgi:hypothetical protein